jgi:hypothetical protein
MLIDRDTNTIVAAGSVEVGLGLDFAEVDPYLDRLEHAGQRRLGDRGDSKATDWAMS